MFLKVLLALLLAGFLVAEVSALPVEVEREGSLKVSSQGETLFEVENLDEAKLKTLLEWLESPPSGVKISSSDGAIVGLPVKLVVTPAIASRWKSEPKGLAQLFSERLNSVLGDSLPSWNVNGQVVPLNESRTVRLAPFRPGLTVTAEDPQVVALEELGNGRFRLTGVANGRTSLLVDSSQGLAVSALPVSVKPWAARWGEGPGRLAFWGTPSRSRVDTAVKRWLSARTYAGAQVSVSGSEGKEGQMTYTATAKSPNAISVEETFKVTVERYEAQKFPKADLVALSNHPERIVSDGVLFKRRLEKTPFRFMWHHRNDPEGPDRFLVLELANPTNVTRRLRVLWYSYGPSPDEIHVGHTAALDYAEAGLLGQGEEFVLPANGNRTIEIRKVKAGQTMSGMAFFADLSGAGAPIEVTVSATSGDGTPTERAEMRDKGRTASGVFAAAIESDASHILGGPFTYIEFGAEPYVTDVVEQHPSYGNFGTVYRTRLMLKNPTSQVKEAQVGFASGGGAARGVLSLDGALYDLPMGVTGDGLPVRTYTVQPGEVIQVDVELFPQAGSNYPVRVVVKSDFERLEKEDVAPLRPLVPYIP